MNKIVCHCNAYLLYRDDEQGKKDKAEFKENHRHHVHPPVTKFKIYPSELIQIARNMISRNEDDDGRQ